MTEADPCRWTVLEAREQLAGGAISITGYVRALLDRADAVAGLNALTYSDRAALLRAAEEKESTGFGPGRLEGIPLVVKDAIDTEDAPTSGGTGALAGRVPPADADVVHRLRREGALIAGKCTMHELGFGITSNNAVTGPARNPYNPRMIAGGSSGGTAAAVAAGIAPAGLGADTGGSVRLPAAMCGLVGFRPTVGRYSARGVVPISRTRDTVGPMARSVADVRLLDAVLAGDAAGEAAAVEPRGTRLGVPETAFYRDLEPAVEEVVARALDLLADAGVDLVTVDLDEVVRLSGGAGMAIALYEFPRDLTRYLEDSGCGLSLDDVRRGVGSPDVQAIWDSQSGAGRITDEQYGQALADRQEARRAYAGTLERHGLAGFVQPTAPLTARPIGDDETVELNGRRVPTFATFIRHTDVAGTLGLPGISLPAGLSSHGLPVGFELGAAPGDDLPLLALAAAIEPILPPTPGPALELAAAG